MTVKTNAGLEYVNDFSFSPAQGFTGSAGKQSVKGYMRGGHVTKDSMHAQLTREGEAMGFAQGGQVKARDTSSEFVEKHGKQDTMDDGVQPKRRGRDQAEIEAGGVKRVKMRYNRGGNVRSVRYKEGGKAKKARRTTSKDLPGTGTLKKAGKGIEKHAGRRQGALAQVHKALGIKKVAKKASGGVVHAAEGKWIQGAIKHPGALRKTLGVKKGENIPAGKLAKAAKGSGVTGRRARLAETLKGMN